MGWESKSDRASCKRNSQARSVRESSVVKVALLGEGVSGNSVAVLVIFPDLAAVYTVDSNLWKSSNSVCVLKNLAEHILKPLGALKVKNQPAKRETRGLIPGWGRFPGEGNCNPLQYSCLKNAMDRGGWWATVHGAKKSQTRPND